MSWSVRRRAGLRRVAAGGVVLSAVTGLLAVLPALPASAFADGTKAHGRDKSVPVSELKPKGSKPAALPEWHGSKAVWPAAGSAVVDLLAEASGERRGQATVGGLPVVFSSSGSVDVAPAGRVIAPAGPAKVTVEVAKHAAVPALGGAAVVLRVARADGGTGPAKVRVQVGYGSFRHAYGGDWANRLRLVTLPRCALTTPAMADCWAATPLRSTNNAASATVTADVDLRAASFADIAVPGSSAGDGSLVMALAAGVSSETGDFEQTSLSQSASWQAGGSSAAFSWSYPIAVPPVPGGLAPSVSLDYSSASVDGQTADNNTQPGWVGEGWSYEPGFIERSFRWCDEDTTITPTWTESRNLCWRMQNARIMWNGRSTELVANDSSSTPNTAMPTVWHLADDDGTKIEYLRRSRFAVRLREGRKTSVTSGWSTLTALD